MDELNNALNALADAINRLEEKFGKVNTGSPDLAPAVNNIKEMNTHIDALLAKIP